MAQEDMITSQPTYWPQKIGHGVNSINRQVTKTLKSLRYCLSQYVWASLHQEEDDDEMQLSILEHAWPSGVIRGLRNAGFKEPAEHMHLLKSWAQWIGGCQRGIRYNHTPWRSPSKWAEMERGNNVK